MPTKRRHLAQRRKVMGYTQEQLAEQLGVDRTTVIRWEAGETEPLPWQWPNLAAALHITGEQLSGLLTEGSSRQTIIGQLATSAVTPSKATDPSPAAALVEPPSAILLRIREQSVNHLTNALLDALDIYVAEVVDRYEADGPATLA